MVKRKLQKLNLGCGKDYRQGWVNLDAVATVEPDIVHDLNQPLPFADDSFDEILAQDILEHFTKEQVEQVVFELSRVLAPGGKLIVRVPNLNDIIERFSNDEDTRNEFIYGTTFETGVFGAHKVGFSKIGLISLMLLHQFKLREIRAEETNFVATFTKQAQNDLKKELIYVNQTLGFGGAEVFMSDLLASLNSLGWKINVYTNYEPFFDLLASKNIKVGKIETVVDVIGDWKGLIKAFFLWPKLTVEYARIVSSSSEESIFLMSGFIEKIIISPLLALYGRSNCWIEFGPMETIFAKFFRMPKALYFLVKSLPERVITSSYHSRQSLTSVSRISLAKLRVIGCGRDLKGKNPRPNIKPNSEELIVCVSRLESGKGQDLLLKAFKIIAKNHPAARLKIIGEGDFVRQLVTLASELGLSKRVDFLGRVEDALQEMAKAKMVVFPSVWPLEGFGLVMIEAMSLGQPVVAFNRGPGDEVISHEQTGLLADDGDINSLAEQIERILDDPKLAKRIGQNARNHFEQNYKIESVAKLYEQTLLEALACFKAKRVVGEK